MINSSPDFDSSELRNFIHLWFNNILMLFRQSG